jgi:intergrase/recombinase
VKRHVAVTPRARAQICSAAVWWAENRSSIQAAQWLTRLELAISGLAESGEHLIDTLLAATGTSWWTRSDAVIAAARYLGFRRTGKNIQAAFKSVINAAVRRGLIERNGTDLIRKAH